MSSLSGFQYPLTLFSGSGSKSSSGFLSAGFSGHSRRSASPAISERRLSVRQTECAYKYKDILVKKTNKFTQIILCTASSNQKNVLTVKVSPVIFNFIS